MRERCSRLYIYKISSVGGDSIVVPGSLNIRFLEDVNFFESPDDPLNSR
jgi:hypothetical protein